ncbi:MAG: hypothetical protein WBX03_00845, partial [Terriglobales bacterium]
MPIRKPQVSREKAAIYSGCLRQLQDEGQDFEIPEEWRERGRALNIDVAPPWENMLFNVYHDGIAYYAIWVCLV